MEVLDHSSQVVDHYWWSEELHKVVVVLLRSLSFGRIVSTINNPLFLGSWWNSGSIVVEYGRAIRIASVERLCGRRVKVRHFGCLSGIGH